MGERDAGTEHHGGHLVPPPMFPGLGRDAVLHGSGEDEIQFNYDDGLRSYKTKKAFEGVIPNIERRWRETDSAWVREELSRFQSTRPCAVCGGKRLKPEALAVRVGDLDIAATDLGMVLGSNVSECSPITTDYIWRARDRGARLIVVDPRLTPIARTADLFLPVRPGRDSALMNAIARSSSIPVGS